MDDGRLDLVQVLECGDNLHNHRSGFSFWYSLVLKGNSQHEKQKITRPLPYVNRILLYLRLLGRGDNPLFTSNILYFPSHLF